MTGQAVSAWGPNAAVRPPYRVPSMPEVAATPPNGLRVVSLFSGCGGSCLGWRMAGFRVAWGCEFVPAARDCYRANFPQTPLDPRDVRDVTPADILAATELAEGELDVLEGSPPCASFSTVGSRQAGWGRVRPYSDTRQRTDDLFFEYARLLRGLRPRAFVAENVGGLVRGAAKGYFLDILAALKGCGYRVGARLLDAQWLGVPQSRGRIIFVGVRDDLPARPAFPRPLPYRYSVRDALALPDGTFPARVVYDTGGQFSRGDVTDRPCPAITVGSGGSDAGHYRVESMVERLGGEDGPALGGSAIGAEWDRLRPGQRSGRYHVLSRPHPDRPCPAVLATGGDGHTASVTHPRERRKFTIAELRRLCGFPDDFLLTGTYAQQWERLGRAVPPVMMCHIAATVRDEILIGECWGTR